MDFISVDLIGPFEIKSRGNQYALTMNCMLTNYVMCLPLVDKSADVVVNTYFREINCRY